MPRDPAACRLEAMDFADHRGNSGEIEGPPANLKEWRRALRRELLQARAGITPNVHAEWSRKVLARLTASFASIEASVVGVYWPMRGEVDLSPFVASVRAAGGRVALPVVLKEDEPLEFRIWESGASLTCDACGIPCPEQAAAVVPDVLLVPLVGFDEARFRLGYGGGYYDRTLASFRPGPLTIGVGFEMSRVETIHPQAYDIAMDHIVSERQVRPRAAPVRGAGPW